MTPTPHSRRDVLKGAAAIAAAASVGTTSARRATAQGSAKAQIDGGIAATGGVDRLVALFEVVVPDERLGEDEHRLSPSFRGVLAREGLDGGDDGGRPLSPPGVNLVRLPH